MINYCQYSEKEDKKKKYEEVILKDSLSVDETNINASFHGYDFTEMDDLDQVSSLNNSIFLFMIRFNLTFFRIDPMTGIQKAEVLIMDQLFHEK